MKEGVIGETRLEQRNTGLFPVSLRGVRGRREVLGEAKGRTSGHGLAMVQRPAALGLQDLARSEVDGGLSTSAEPESAEAVASGGCPSLGDSATATLAHSHAFPSLADSKERVFVPRFPRELQVPFAFLPLRPCLSDVSLSAHTAPGEYLF